MSYSLQLLSRVALANNIPSILHPAVCVCVSQVRSLRCAVVIAEIWVCKDNIVHSRWAVEGSVGWRLASSMHVICSGRFSFLLLFIVVVVVKARSLCFFLFVWLSVFVLVRRLSCHLDSPNPPLVGLLQLQKVRRLKVCASLAVEEGLGLSAVVHLLFLGCFCVCSVLSGPISRDCLSGRSAPTHSGAIAPPWLLVSHRHICAIPHFATYRAIILRHPTKTITK